MASFCFKIAEIVLSVETETPLRSLGETYEEFRSQGEREDVSLRLRLGGIPKIDIVDPEESFNLGAWSLLFSEGRWVLTLPSEHTGSSTLAVFEEDFSQGDIYCSPSHIEDESMPQILSHPIHQILMVSVLSRGRGGMFHGAGIDDEGDGYLFLGRSADGKSTLANLWRGGRILDDDRIIVREKNERFWMYGTPWHSLPYQTFPSGLPVKRVFFLRKGDRNLAIQKAGIDTLSLMLQRCFLPFWDRDGAGYVLDLCTRIAERVPCSELTFTRDDSVVDYVRDLPG